MTSTTSPSTGKQPSGMLAFLKQGWIWIVMIGFIGVVVWYVSAPFELEDPGNPAPDFTLPTLGGGEFTLSEHRGEVVVLSFWATWCPSCRTELPAKQRLHGDLGDKPVTFIGISIDQGGLETVREFASDHTLTFTQVADRARLVQAYETGGGVPTTVVVDQDGYIRFFHSGVIGYGPLRNVIERLLEE